MHKASGCAGSLLVVSMLMMVVVMVVVSRVLLLVSPVGATIQQPLGNVILVHEVVAEPAQDRRCRLHLASLLLLA